MKWRGRRTSRNIEDRRGQRSPRRAGAGVLGGGGIGALAIVLIGMYFGVDLTALTGGMGQGTAPASEQRELSEQDREMGDFVGVTLADTEEIWTEIFRRDLNQTYDPATLVLFSGATQSGCGLAGAATGPFYCPPEEKIFLDTDFFITLDRQLGAGGDFAAAYVIAHEVAHHVQQELGILGEVNRERSQATEVRSNELSVMIELQADCFSGVWAREAGARFGSIERGDIAEAMNAAARIGDDALQRNAGQTVRPDSFTHGTSDQRQSWFARGYDSGDIGECDTFAARTL